MAEQKISSLFDPAGAALQTLREEPRYYLQLESCETLGTLADQGKLGTSINAAYQLVQHFASERCYPIHQSQVQAVVEKIERAGDAKPFVEESVFQECNGSVNTPDSHAVRYASEYYEQRSEERHARNLQDQRDRSEQEARARLTKEDRERWSREAARNEDFLQHWGSTDRASLSKTELREIIETLTPKQKEQVATRSLDFLSGSLGSQAENALVLLGDVAVPYLLERMRSDPGIAEETVHMLCKAGGATAQEALLSIIEIHENPVKLCALQKLAQMVPTICARLGSTTASDLSLRLSDTCKSKGEVIETAFIQCLAEVYVFDKRGEDILIEYARGNDVILAQEALKALCVRTGRQNSLAGIRALTAAVELTSSQERKIAKEADKLVRALEKDGLIVSAVIQNSYTSPFECAEILQLIEKKKVRASYPGVMKGIEDEFDLLLSRDLPKPKMDRIVAVHQAWLRRDENDLLLRSSTEALETLLRPAGFQDGDEETLLRPVQDNQGLSE